MESHRRVDAVYAGYALDSRSDYRAFLRAHARALGALESAAGNGASRLPLLADDLAALDAALPAPLPLAAADTDGFRWGLRYALEGSRLGGAMLSRQVGAGLPRSYLCAVHGKGEWVAFQRALDSAAAEGGEGWLGDAVQGAQAAFALFAQAGEAEKAAVHG
ncbi:heme oxygenase [Sphingobium sp. HBC34]|uniref:Heme oxygenase n=1 Tax=Sphingobium cyanobacteriorum TaxID=3063954 RepID=A0ABT8ZQW2_9SPHN|nr:heme oxygenase [Sphingobium sp. HBC34]MDO7836937.1 heme oxygenase [Sphingobium sp. HBC34]